MMMDPSTIDVYTREWWGLTRMEILQRRSEVAIARDAAAGGGATARGGGGGAMTSGSGGGVDDLVSVGNSLYCVDPHRDSFWLAENYSDVFSG
jgi:hypothetical protein